MNSWIKTNKQHLAHSHTFQSHPLNINIIVDYCRFFFLHFFDWYALNMWVLCAIDDVYHIGMHSLNLNIIQHTVNMLWLHFMIHEQLLIKMHHDVSTSNEMIEWNKSMYRNIENVDDKVVKIHTNILSIFKLRHWRNTSFHWKLHREILRISSERLFTQIIQNDKDKNSID